MITGKKIPISEKEVPHDLDFFDFTVSALDTIYVYFKYYPMKRLLPYKVDSYRLGLFYMDPHEVLYITRNMGILKGLILSCGKKCRKGHLKSVPRILMK